MGKSKIQYHRERLKTNRGLPLTRLDVEAAACPRLRTTPVWSLPISTCSGDCKVRLSRCKGSIRESDENRRRRNIYRRGWPDL